MKTMAIIRDVHCGVGDRGMACLWFTVYTTESTAALQVLSWEQAKTLLESTGIDDVYRLSGKPCWVDQDNGIIRYIEMAKI